MGHSSRKAYVLAASLFWASVALAGATDGQKCEADKLKRAGKYALCRLKAHAKGVKKSQLPDFAKCDQQIVAKFGKAESKWGGACPTFGDVGAIQSLVTDDADESAVLLSDGTLPVCGNGVAEGGEQCDGADLGGATCARLVANTGGVLGCTPACQFDVSGCSGLLGGALPATGQITSYVAGDDGDLEAGAPLSYVDNGDGTITDLNTGLMWEKKSDDGSMHDMHNCYPWAGICSGDGTTPCGTDVDCAVPGGSCDAADGQVAWPNGQTIFEYVERLNNVAFAGYTDWRVPNVKELESIVDYGRSSPSVDPVFHVGCLIGCTVATCSCTAPNSYWSSSVLTILPSVPWVVGFFAGGTVTPADPPDLPIRAVRGGP